MIERLTDMFRVRHKKQKESRSSSFHQEEVKGYMLIRNSMPAQSLSIKDYLEGKKDSDMQNVGLLSSRYPIYQSVETLLKANQGKEPTVERSCYILSLKFSKEETYDLIRQGEFHKAIVTAESFEEVSATVRQNKGPAR